MAIIKPSKKFVGSEMSGGEGGKYVKPDIRQVIFNKTSNKDGAYLYFLPAYKRDNTGAGVWFKTINVRDNFGDKFKDKYVVLDANDPVAHFERNFKLHFPEDAEVTEEQNEKTGQMMKKYPNYGRVTRRVVFNVAYSQDLAKGCHVLDLPAYNGANLLQKWLDTPDSRGREKPMVNDPDRAIPVFIKLNSGAGSPWQIPEQLADTDYIYNLDDIFIKKTPQELIAKLKEMFTPDVFEACMAGYPGYGSEGGVKATVASNPIVAKPVESESVVKPNTAKAVVNIPKVNTKKSEEAPEVEDDIDTTPSDLDSNPLAESEVTAEEAKAFLKRGK